MIDRALTEKCIEDIVSTCSLVEEMEKRDITIFDTGQRKKAVCPFHGDTDPSLVIYENDGPAHAHCFGCNAHMNVFWFVHEWGKKYEKNWSFKKTIQYFTDNYPSIRSLTDIGDIDNSFVEEDAEIKELNMDKTTMGDFYRTSKTIREALRESPNPEFDLHKIKPYIKAIDSLVYDIETPNIGIKEESMKRAISELDKIRYPEKSSFICERIRGNIESKIMIISSSEDVSSVMEGLFCLGKTDNDVFILLSDMPFDNYEKSFSHLVREYRFFKILIVGERSKMILFRNTDKTIDDLNGESRTVDFAGKRIEIMFSHDGSDPDNLNKNIKWCFEND